MVRTLRRLTPCSTWPYGSPRRGDPCLPAKAERTRTSAARIGLPPNHRRPAPIDWREMAPESRFRPRSTRIVYTQWKVSSRSRLQSGSCFNKRDAMNHKAWVAKAAKQSMALESVDLGPLGAED